MDTESSDPLPLSDNNPPTPPSIQPSIPPPPPPHPHLCFCLKPLLLRMLLENRAVGGVRCSADHAAASLQLPVMLAAADEPQHLQTFAPPPELQPQSRVDVRPVRKKGGRLCLRVGELLKPTCTCELAELCFCLAACECVCSFTSWL